MPSLRFIVPGPPIGKERSRTSPHKKLSKAGKWYHPHFTPQRTHNAEDRVWMDFWMVAIQWAALNKRKTSIIPEIRKSERVKIDLKCFFANKRHPDLDNIQKLVWDALSDHRKGSVLCSKERLGDDKRFFGSIDFEYWHEPGMDITISWEV